MQTHEALVEKLIRTGVLSTPKIIDAFRAIDRKHFTETPYEDRPQPIGYEQTISQPTTVAMMLEWLQPTPGERILDVGSGSGYTTALLAHIVGETGRVFGVELVPELVAQGKKNLEQYDFMQATIREATEQIGLSTEAPFNKILVNAAAKQLPNELVEQLCEGGKLVIPINNSIWELERTTNDLLKKEHYGFSFVPLIN